jgi:uracil-DNA glycosylase family 4
VGFDSLDRRITSCSRCSRLVNWREAVAQTRRRAYMDWEYWGKPVPGFGDHRAPILAVGLAPGAHGSNRTGRQFTGDASGRFLFPALHRAGLSTSAESVSREDGLRLRGLYLTATCRCVPPANKPTSSEVLNCRPYLEEEIRLLVPRVIVCLGRLAFASVANIHSLRPSEHRFSHGACFDASAGPERGQRWLLCSYHPSQQNTQTGKLTPAMFDWIWKRAKELAQDA